MTASCRVYRRASYQRQCLHSSTSTGLLGHGHSMEHEHAKSAEHEHANSVEHQHAKSAHANSHEYANSTS